jgi:predicted amidophosphoribosyltransferase
MSFLDETKKKAEEAENKASEEVKEVAGARMSFCSNCGKELDAESNFCPKCGVRTENGVKAGVVIPWTSDPHLRQELDVALQKASKAIDDGVKVVRETLREVAGEVEKGVKQARTSVPVTCQNCGQENTKFAKFCSRCGKEL